MIALKPVALVVKSVLFCIFFGSKSVLVFVVFSPSNYLKMVAYIKEILKNMEHSSNLRVYLQTGQGDGRTLACFDQSQPAI